MRQDTDRSRSISTSEFAAYMRPPPPPPPPPGLDPATAAVLALLLAMCGAAVWRYRSQHARSTRAAYGGEEHASSKTKQRKAQHNTTQ